jgi:ribosomal protein L40E
MRIESLTENDVASAAGLAYTGGAEQTAAMPLRKTREQRGAQRAEMEQHDREHAARLAAVSAEGARPPLFCQDCEAKLKPTATSCHYCGSQNLGASNPSCSLFSEVAPEGACPRCHGTSFTAPGLTGPMTVSGFLADGGLAVLSAAAGATTANTLIICVTCGARFTRG